MMLLSKFVDHHTKLSFVLSAFLLLTITLSFGPSLGLARHRDVSDVEQISGLDGLMFAPVEHTHRKRAVDQDDKDIQSMDNPPPNQEIKNSTVKKTATTTQQQNGTTKVPNSSTTSLISSDSNDYDARDITYFLESHPAHSVIDPRVYFTEERTSRSLAIMLSEMHKIPARLRFAFTVRVFNELGRKIASKLDYYAAVVTAILRKTPDDLGNKPEVSMIVDAVDNAFESKADFDPKEENDFETTREDPISSLIKDDKEKDSLMDSSITEMAKKFAHIISYFGVNVMKTSGISIPAAKREAAANLLADSLRSGSDDFVGELYDYDKFRVVNEIAISAERMLNITLAIFKRHMKDADDNVGEKVLNGYKSGQARSFKDLNPISDKTGLMGSWNNFLFTDLGNSERVLKVFAGLLSRVPPRAKSRYINMYIGQVNSEIARTLSGFVTMQGMPLNGNLSEVVLLNPKSSVKIVPNKLPKPRSGYDADKNRIPARCYLAGRRWRLFLTRGLIGYDEREQVIKSIADKIGELKVKLVYKDGNEIYRLCLPRVEVGLRGWGINGDPQATGGQSEKLSMRSPIDKLLELDDPFVAGVKLGYNIGVKVGYNEERNATLEMERAAHNSGEFIANRVSEVKYLALASYRRAATVGAKKAFEIALREGYMTTLKLSIRAGMKIPSESASKLAMLRAVSVAGQIGSDTGRSVAESYLLEKKVPDEMRDSLVKVGKTHGLLAGETIGKAIGALIGKEAAQEAYRRAIIRGGKVSRAKFHLEEYEAGANLGFDRGLKEGKRIASSSKIDPSAPRFFRFPSQEEGDKAEVDHWEKDVIPKLSDEAIDEIHTARNHTLVSGSLKGKYKIAKEVKKGMKRISYTNETYALEMFASGFIRDNVAYLTLNGTVDKMGNLRGSLIARDIFNEDH